MPIPPNAINFSQTLDPYDSLDFALALSQGDPTLVPPPFLLTGESVAAFTLSTTAEAAAAGLTIKTGGLYGPTLAGLNLTFWVEVASGLQSSALFDGAGVSLGLELSVTTNSNPPRKKQRTLVVKVAQQ